MAPRTINRRYNIPFNVRSKPNQHCHCEHNDDGSYDEEDAYGCRSKHNKDSSFLFTNTQHTFNVRLCSTHGNAVINRWNIDGTCKHATCEEQISSHNSLQVRRKHATWQQGYCPVHYAIEEIVVPFEEENMHIPTNNVGLYQHNKAANRPDIFYKLVQALFREDSRNIPGVTNLFPQRLIEIIGEEFIGSTYTTYNSDNRFGARIVLTEKVNGLSLTDSFEQIDTFVNFYNGDYRDAIKVIESLGEEELTQGALQTMLGWRSVKEGLNSGDTKTLSAPPEMNYYTDGLEWKFRIDVYEDRSSSTGKTYRLSLVLPPGKYIPNELCLVGGKTRFETNSSGQIIYKWHRRDVYTIKRMVKVLTKMYGGKLLSRGASTLNVIPSSEVRSRDILIQLIFSRLCKLYPAFVDKFRGELDKYKEGNHARQNQIVEDVYTAIENDNGLGRILIEDDDELTDGLTFVVVPRENFPLIAHAIFGQLGGSRVYESTTDEAHNWHLGIVDSTAEILAVEHKTSTVDPTETDAIREKVRTKSGIEDNLVKGFRKLLLDSYPAMSQQQLAAITMKNKRKSQHQHDDNSEGGSKDSEGDSMEDDSEDDDNSSWGSSNS